MGAAAAAGTAIWLGVKGPIVALFIGAFAVSMGLMFGRMIKKQYIKYQAELLAIISFLTTVLPVYPLLKSGTPADYYPFMVSVAGDYGGLLNKTYLLSIPLLAALLGGIIVALAPYASGQITKARQGKTVPYQGIMLTFAVLIIIAAVMQFTLP